MADAEGKAFSLVQDPETEAWKFSLQVYHHTVKPPNTADLGTGEKAAVLRKRRYWESYLTLKTHIIWDLQMGGGIGGGAVLRGTTV